MRWCTLLVSLFLLVVGFTPDARADAPPSDVSLAQFGEAALPPVPDGYLQRQDGAVRWEYPAEAGTIVDGLANDLRHEWPRIERELGAEIEDGLIIRIGRNPDEMAALAPAHAPPPPYAVGVAYPASGLILLTLSAPETWERPDVTQVLTHELSHIALHRAVNGQPVPRWLTEGLAIHQARERSLERVQTLWEATVRGQLIALDDLSHRFPSQPHEVSIAYAQSADFIRWLNGRESSGQHFAELIRRIRSGQPFETAVSQTYSQGIGQLEYAWRNELTERYGAFPLLLGTGVIWFGIALLVVVAWFRRRADSKRILERWESEDGERDMPEPSAAPQLSRPDGSVARPEGDTRPGSDIPPPAEIPTVVWEGRSHTLH